MSNRCCSHHCHRHFSFLSTMWMVVDDVNVVRMHFFVGRDCCSSIASNRIDPNSCVIVGECPGRLRNGRLSLPSLLRNYFVLLLRHRALVDRPVLMVLPWRLQVPASMTPWMVRLSKNSTTFGYFDLYYLFGSANCLGCLLSQLSLKVLCFGLCVKVAQIVASREADAVRMVALKRQKEKNCL